MHLLVMHQVKPVVVAFAGKPWYEALLNSALLTLAEDVNITANAPGACRSPAVILPYKVMLLGASPATLRRGNGEWLCIVPLAVIVAIDVVSLADGSL